MARPKKNKEVVQTAKGAKTPKGAEQYYISFKKPDGSVDLEAIGASFEGDEEVLHTAHKKFRMIANSWMDNYGPGNVSVRSPMQMADFENLRPEQAKPTDPKEIIALCMSAYYDGLIRNIVDTMGDFSVQGMDIVHRNKSQEKFHKAWFHQVVDGKHVSERFANYIIRCAVALPRRVFSDLSIEDEKTMKRGEAATFKKDKPTPTRRIPTKYVFQNPLSVEIVNKKLSALLTPDEYQFAVLLPDELSAYIRDGKKPYIQGIPPYLLDLVNKKESYIPIKKEEMTPYYYKKDDWDLWPIPIIYSALDDIFTLRQLKLADRAALDGIISQVRIWKLGSLQHEIAPTPKALSKLAQALRNSMAGGNMDIVWGPDIELIESKSTAYNFLGNEKYVATLNAIFQTFGFPIAMSSSGGGERGITATFIGVKTLIERLQYVRNVLQSFWDYECRLVQKALGWKYPAQVVFDRPILNDEATEKQVWLALADRNFASVEAIQERFGLIPEVETMRIRREQRMIERKKLPPKAGPYHDPQHKQKMEQLLVQQGVQPSELGHDIPKVKIPPKSKPTGKSGQGRPGGSKDKKKRKQKTVKPSSKAAAIEYSRNLQAALFAQEIIAEEFNSFFLKACEKGNLRQLSNEEFEQLEATKFALLCHCDLNSVISSSYIQELLKGDLQVSVAAESLYNEMLRQYKEENNQGANIKIARYYQAAVAALIKTEMEEGDSGEN